MSIISARLSETLASPEGIMIAALSAIAAATFVVVALGICEWLERRAIARRKREMARKPIQRPEIAWPESPMRRVVREALEDKRRA